MFIILAILLIVLGILFFLFWKGEEMAPQTTTEVVSTKWTITPATQTEQGQWEVQDKEGNTYYTTTTEDEEQIFVRDAQGKTYERWSVEKGSASEQIVIAGRSDSLILFFYTEESLVTCEGLWETERDYRGIAFGTVSYSGATQVHLQEEEALLPSLRAACSE